jgi:hypothetical protein
METFASKRKDVGLAQFDFTPRCVRHSGPSCDFSQKARTATEIQVGYSESYPAIPKTWTDVSSHAKDSPG